MVMAGVSSPGHPEALHPCFAHVPLQEMADWPERPKTSPLQQLVSHLGWTAPRERGLLKETKAEQSGAEAQDAGGRREPGGRSGFHLIPTEAWAPDTCWTQQS